MSILKRKETGQMKARGIDVIMAELCDVLDEAVKLSREASKNKASEKSERWRAERSHGYYLISGESFCPRWESDSYSIYDQSLYEMGNYFHTMEEAEKAAQHIKDYLFLLTDTKGFNPDWADEGEDKHYVTWCSGCRKLETGSTLRRLSGKSMYFRTAEDAQDSIKSHDYIWRRYLGVEE